MHDLLFSEKAADYAIFPTITYPESSSRIAGRHRTA
jgi:hypothetical protein